MDFFLKEIKWLCGIWKGAQEITNIGEDMETREALSALCWNVYLLSH